MSDGTVSCRIEGRIAHVTFDRPAARNAMTWAMYGELAAACDRIAADKSLRVAVLRGAGGKAFVAGTDIAQFLEFKDGEDGIRYERAMADFLGRLESLPVPTLAVLEGWAIGGGLAIASLCDIRIATPGTRFGVPIARTLGNCLSIGNYAVLTAAFGMSRVRKMLVLGENLTTDEALASGFLSEVVPPDRIDARAAELAQRLAENAPITMRVTRESLRRLLHAGWPADDDLVRACYGSRDFAHGVESFVAKRAPQWTGR